MIFSAEITTQIFDVIENDANVIEKSPHIVVNVTENVTNNDTNGTMRNDAERYEDIEKLILDKMRADKRVSIKQLSKLFGKSKTSMFRIIDKLKAEGKIRRVGSEKSGTWEVFE